MARMLAQLTIHEPGREHPVWEDELPDLRAQGLIRTEKGRELVRAAPDDAPAAAPAAAKPAGKE